MIKQMLCVLLTVAGLAQAAPPLEHFFETESFKDAKLSPSGRYVALRVGNSPGRDSLVVLDSATLENVGGARMADMDVGEVRWVNDDRLVFNIIDRTVGPGDRRFAPGLYSISRDGKALRQLVNHGFHEMSTIGTNIKTRLEPWNTYLLPQDGGQDSEFIFVQRPVWPETNSYAIKRVDLIKLNTVNGQSSFVDRPATSMGWMLDHKGQPSVMLSESEGNTTIHYRDASGSWRDIATIPSYALSKNGIEPLGFLDDKYMLVKARRNGDKAALHALELATGKVNPEPMVELADFDFEGSMVYSKRRLVGIHYLADARSTAWFDPALKAAQQAVDKKLPGLINTITPPVAPDSPWLLVASHADRQPRFYALYNSQSGEIKGIGGAHPSIKPSDMGQVAFAKFRARDGLEVPVWLTTPARSGKKLPMVVLVHGGPYVRGQEWNWDADAQFLASRGYAVLEPEFRGSTGYGLKLFQAGMKQWGLKMQDDIADSVKWAVEKGIADPKRVCIMGGSYGGYATLMGLVNDPGLYRCGIAYAAVTDIPAMFESGMTVLSDIHDDYMKYGVPELIGDLNKDAAQFAATSPLKQAARITAPLLMAHGSSDRRVPAPHFRRLRSALPENKANEFVEYSGEGHGWSTAETRIDFWRRVEKFLDRHIGAGAKTE
jgi:dienelactone hydrolase